MKTQSLGKYFLLYGCWHSLPLFGETSAGDGRASVIFPVVNLVIFGAMVVYFVRTPLKKYLIEKTENINRVLNSLNEALNKSTEANKTIDSKLEKLQEEIMAIEEEAENSAQRLRKQHTDQLKLAAEKISQETQRQIESNILAAKNELRTMVINEVFSEIKNHCGSGHKTVKVTDLTQISNELENIAR